MFEIYTVYLANHSSAKGYQTLLGKYDRETAYGVDSHARLWLRYWPQHFFSTSYQLPQTFRLQRQWSFKFVQTLCRNHLMPFGRRPKQSVSPMSRDVQYIHGFAWIILILRQSSLVCSAQSVLQVCAKVHILLIQSRGCLSYCFMGAPLLWRHPKPMGFNMQIIQC